MLKSNFSDKKHKTSNLLDRKLLDGKNKEYECRVFSSN